MINTKEVYNDLIKYLYLYSEFMGIPYTWRTKDVLIYMTYPLYKQLCIEYGLYTSFSNPRFNGYKVRFLMGEDYRYQISSIDFSREYKEVDNG